MQFCVQNVAYNSTINLDLLSLKSKVLLKSSPFATKARTEIREQYIDNGYDS